MRSLVRQQRLAIAAGFLALVHLSCTGSTAQEWPPSDESDPANPGDAVEVEKKPGGRFTSLNTALEKKGGARSFSSFQPIGDTLGEPDDAFREKRPGGRFTSAFAEHELQKRPGARFIASSGGFGGGMVKRPGGRYFYGDSSRAKRPGGRYYGYQGDLWKRLGGRYMAAGGGSGRWKRAGGRHIGGSYYSFYGGANRNYRSNWGRN